MRFRFLASVAILTGSVILANSSARCQTANLSLSKAAVDDAIVGSNFVYTITTTNNGPNAAHNLVISDPIPPQLFIIGANAPAGGGVSVSGNAVTFSLGTLNVGTVASATITVQVTTTGTAVNAATVTATESDANSADNTSTATTTLRPAIADMQVSKTVSTNAAAVGSPVNYQIIITNNGPDTAHNVVITDPVPTQLQVSGATAPSGAGVSLDGHTVIFNMPTLSAGTSVTGTISTNAVTPGSAVNATSVTASEVDPSAANNTSTVTTAIRLKTADLHLTKTSPSANVLVGSTVVYTLTTVNNGPDDATNVVITDHIPSGMAIQGANAPPGGGVAVNGSDVSFFFSLAAFATANSTITVNAANVGTFSNVANVAAFQVEPTPADNTSTRTIVVRPPTAELSVVKIANPEPVFLENNVTYNLLVTNSGPDPATNIKMVDALPGDATFLNGGLSQGSAVVSSLSTGTLTNFSLGTLQPNTSASAQLVFKVHTPGQLINTATVHSDQADNNAANSTASTTSNVHSPLAQLTVTKTPSSAILHIGDPLTYTVAVQNIDTITTDNIVLTDPLPAGLTFVSASTTKGTVTNSNGTILVQVGTLAPTQSATVTIHATVDQLGLLKNTATASGGTSSTATVSVVPRTNCFDPATSGGFASVTCSAAKSQCTIAAQVRVQNLGDLTTPKTTVQFFLSADDVLSDNDLPLRTAKLAALKPGKLKRVKLKAKLDSSQVVSGMKLIAVIDPTSALAECDELNNEVVVPLAF